MSMTHRWAPGAVKMWRLLNAHGIICGKHRVRRLRKLENIQTSRIKRFRAIQAMQRVQPPAPDLVKRGFNVTVPNTIWVGDITSMRTREGWLHLAIVLDLFARRIVGWSMDASQSAALDDHASFRSSGSRRSFPRQRYRSKRPCGSCWAGRR